MIKSYLSHCFCSTPISKVNNPFVKRLNDSVFSKLNTVDDRMIISYVKELKLTKLTLKVTDLGAGSKKTKNTIRSVKSIVKNAAISKKFGRLLVLMILDQECKTIIELGTSLGVGTSYLACSFFSQVYTIEGCPKISEFAQNRLKDLKNIKYYIGEFSNQLDTVLTQAGIPDLVYIDGNHTYNGTMNYFNYFLKHSHDKTILIFDDIHWSSGMEKAWYELIKSEYVTLSIDLFRMGIVFLDQSLPKEDLVVRF